MTNKKINAAIILLICLIVSALGFGFYKIKAENSYDRNHIGIDLPKQSAILKQEDDHGGFHGDGEYYCAVQLTEEGATKFTDDAAKTGKWSPLPMSKDIAFLIYGSDPYDNDHMSKNIPKNLKNGIYYVRDRFAEEDPTQKNKNILSRGAYNVTISILDFDTKILYIYELDT